MIDVAVDPIDPSVAIVGGWAELTDNGSDAVVYKTEDGGANWYPVFHEPYPPDDGWFIAAVLISPHDSGLYLAALCSEATGDTIIYRSEDAGATWPDSYTIPGLHVISLAAHGSNPGIVYAGTGHEGFSFTQGPHRVWRSSDGGLSWAEVNPDAGGPLAWDARGIVWTVWWQQVWYSEDDGDTWELKPQHLDDGGISFGVDGNAGRSTALYVGTGSQGVYKSPDDGGFWERVNNNIYSPLPLRNIDVDPGELDKIFAAGECGGGWLIYDGGWSWGQPDGQPDCMYDYEIKNGDPSTIFAGADDCSRGAVLRSVDDGISFEPVYTAPHIIPDCSGGREGIHAVATAPSAPDIVYAAGSDQVADPWPGGDWGPEKAVRGRRKPSSSAALQAVTRGDGRWSSPDGITQRLPPWPSIPRTRTMYLPAAVPSMRGKRDSCGTAPTAVIAGT
jgi:photosystem II stability/assembly factor-like uncharacterized protein